MAKRIVSGITGLLFALSVAGFAAQAGDRSADAVGYDVIYNALSFKKIKNDSNITQLIFGADYESQPAGTDKSLLDFTLALRFRSKLVSAKSVRVDSFWGLGVQKIDSHTTNVGQTNFYGELGAAPELFITDNFSVELALGIKLGVIGETASGAGNGYTKISTFATPINLDPGLSFHYYFGRQ